MPEQVRITYYRSVIGRVDKQKRIIRALGFKRLNQSRIVNWHPTIQGMVNKVSHLVKVEALEDTKPTEVLKETKKVKKSAEKAPETVPEVKDDVKESESKSDKADEPLEKEEN